MEAEGLPSYALSVMSEGLSFGDPSFYQNDLDIIHVDAPLLKMQWWMVMFWTKTGICKEMVDGSRGVALSKSKPIRQESVRSIAPRAKSMDFRWVGYVCRTSNANIDEGDCAISPTMLQLWEAFELCHAHWKGHLTIFGMGSIGSWGMFNNVVGVVMVEVDGLGSGGDS